MQGPDDLADHEKWYVEVETNGTIPPRGRFLLEVDRFVVSPKFENFAFATAFTRLIRNVVFKFVISSEKDYSEVTNFVHEFVFDKNKTPVYIMPCCTTVEEHNKQLPALIEFAKIHGFRVTPRLQICAFGSKRGV
jgi:organic radical activating enzyme